MAYSDQVGSPFYVTTEMMVLFLSVPVPAMMRSSNKLYHPNRRQTASIYSIWLVRCLSSPPAPVSRCYSFTSSKKKADPIIILSTIYIIRIYSYCHEQNHPRFRLTVKSSLVSSCEDVFFLHFLLSFGHLTRIRSVIWPSFIRSFGQISTLLQSFFQIHLFRSASVAPICNIYKRYMSL